MKSVEEATFFLSKENVMRENYLLLKRIGFFIKNPFIVFAWTFFMESSILLTIRHLIEADISKGHPTDFLNDLIIMTGSSGMIYAKFTFAFNYKQVKVLVKKLSDFTVFGIPPNFAENRKKIFKFFIFYVFGCMSGSLGYMGIVLSLENSCIERRKIDHLEKLCGSIMPAYWGGKDLEQPPIKQILVFFQIMLVFFVPLSSLAVHGILFASVEHIILKIDHLKLMLKDITSNQDQNIIRQKIKKCVEYHIFIISTVDTLKEIFAGLLLASVTYESLLIGMILAQLLLEAGPQEITHLSAWMVTYYFICLSGQRLHDKSASIQDTISNMDWYNLKKDVAKDLQLVIVRSQKPLTLQAGKLSIIILPTFVNVAKTAYSFVAIIQQSINR